MNKKLLLNLTLIMLLLIGCSSTAQDEPQASPTEVVTETQAEIDDTIAQDDPQASLPDVAAEIQAEMDDLTAGELPPGMVVWIDAPENRFEGASGFANLMDDTPMPPEGAFRIGSITPAGTGYCGCA
jgi:CubicO group peptidase (beta-lactamase class C family)